MGEWVLLLLLSRRWRGERRALGRAHLNGVQWLRHVRLEAVAARGAVQVAVAESLLVTAVPGLGSHLDEDGGSREDDQSASNHACDGGYRDAARAARRACARAGRRRACRRGENRGWRRKLRG